MTTTIQGPDGALIDFPDGTSETEMNAAMAQAYPPQAAAAPQSGVMAGVSRALEANLPFVDRAVAAAKSALPQGYGGTGQDYAANLAAEKSKNAQFEEQNPWTSAVGGLAAYAPAALIPGGAGLWGRIGAGAATGFGLGGLQGLSNSPDLANDEETSRDIAQGAVTGGMFGAAAPAVAHAVGSGVSGLANALRGGPGPADLAALQTAKQAAYQNVKDIGAAYSPQSIQGLTDKIAADAANADIDPSLNPKATSIINNLQARAAAKVKSGEPVTLPELDKWRQFVNDNLSGLPEPKQARFGTLIRNNIDDFVNTGFPGDMVPRPVAKAQSVSGQDTLPLAGSVPQVHPDQAPTPMLDFLRRAGGLQDEGGDLKSMGFSNVNGVAGKGSSKIIDKENGVPMDEGRRMAVEAGYMEPHETVSDFINKLGEHPTYSVHDEEAVAARAAKDAYDYGPQEEEVQPPVAPSQSVATLPFDAESGISSPAASGQEAAAAIRNARDLAMRQFKAQALAKALDKAEIRADTTGSYGNIENATRQRLAALYEKEPWTPDEFSQLKKMAQGTPLTNALSRASKLSPLGHALPFYADLVGAGLGHATIPGATSAVGLGAQGLGALARRSAQNELMRTILAGGTTPARSSAQGPLSRAAMTAALAANADLQASRNQVTPQ